MRPEYPLSPPATRYLGALALAWALAACAGPEPATDGDAGAAGPPASGRASEPPAPLEPAPETQAVIEQLARLKTEQRGKEGIALAREYLAEHPDALRLHYALGIFHGLLNDHASAKTAFEEELRRDPGHVDSYRGLALALTQLGRLEEALAQQSKALELAPEHPKLALDLGRTLSNLGRLDEAEAHLERAAAGMPREGDADAELGLLYRRRGEPERAAEAFSRALSKDSRHMMALSNLGQTLLQLGREAEGRKLLEKHAELATLADQLDLLERSSLLEGVTAANFLRLARVHLARGDDNAAATAYGKALELDPRAATAALGLAALQLKHGQLREATRWTVHTLMIDPESSRAHFILGVIRLRKGQVAEAQEAFATSRRLAPWDAETYRNLADAYRLDGHLELATQAYREAIARAPGSAPAHYGLGLALFLGGDAGPARPAFERAAELDAQDDEGWMMLGISSALAGRAAAAEAAFTRALSLHRIRLLQGESPQRLLQPFVNLPDTGPILADYRQRLSAPAAGLQDR